jgi:hypothetical protein
MHRAAAEPFQVLRTKMEDEWTSQLMAMLGLDAAFLTDHLGRGFPLWPAHRVRWGHVRALGINVSSVFAIPDHAPAEIARVVAARFKNGSKA